MFLTIKQMQIMNVIVKGNTDGSFCDIDQILERLPYKTTKAAIQFSIRYLIQKNAIQKQPLELRRTRMRVTFSPTPEGYHAMRTEYSDPALLRL